MPKVHIFEVKPNIPKNLESLIDLAYNLHWCWNDLCEDLFQRIDPDIWEEVDHNPVKMLGRISQERFLELQKDDAFIDHLERSIRNLEVYLMERSWFQKEYPDRSGMQVAYFSAEFGIHECLPIYSGGLGVLAGDHLKSTSDLGIPILAVGLAYQKGFFQQYLNADGWQQETYKHLDFTNLPMKLVKDNNGHPVIIKIDFPGREVAVQCWKIDIGRAQLYLLDTNTTENNPADRTITDELYVGDLEKRIQQEIVLGIGGYRMLRALDKNPTVFHMNEGHSAFLAVERIRDLMHEHGLDWNEAKLAACAGNIFTTHTPVPAGNDVFPKYVIDKYFREYCASCGLSAEQFMNLGRIPGENENGEFVMPVLAMKLASHTNAVSKLHCQVSRRMWSNLWPGQPENEIPVVSITNGVHPPTWMSREMHNLLARYLGPQWEENPHDAELWRRVDRISDEELWRTHVRGRERLVAFARERLRQQLQNRGASQAEILEAENVLNPEFLTIGFGRRFATYKRATLILNNLDRLKEILTNNERPVQIIFAGKAHPKDEPGKKFIRKIIHISRDPAIRNRMVFIENYDICVGRNMVQGADVWLNNPRRLMEASGTSGMKAAFNGGLNLSILDGWWDEGFKPNLGWTIGKGEEYDDFDLQDDIESNALYDILEQEIVPLFYKKGPNGIPREWVHYMKESMKVLCPEYSTNRMTFEYTEMFYLPAYENFSRITQNEFALAKELSKWKRKVQKGWQQIKVLEVTKDNGTGFKVNDYYSVQVKVQLGALSAEDVSVELYCGKVDYDYKVMEGKSLTLDFIDSEGNGVAAFAGKIPLDNSGRHGFSVRVIPNREKLVAFRELGFITWEERR
ncbi:MAG: alpha-glucan family phosphorylase [candidate division Zixibacteria bacterium]|nr:alpha-glucan family phosphorylase [Candidatus Tariuqbacter arcticus]